jgi:hypothetical protein
MSDLQIYADYMAAIRDRVNKVQTIMAGRIGTGDKDMDAELIFTQFRKIAEGMSYALLAANRVKYSATHSDISTVWKAKELIKRLNAVNPDFYPVGLLEPLVHIPGFKHFERVPDGYLTKDDFSVLYQGSSGVLHVRNPYSTKDPTINVKHTVQEWVSRIQKLLSLHFVQIATGDVWLARIPGEGQVQVSLAAARPALAS